MAGGETPETPASAEGGEKLSKNEQKRREKQAKAAAAKAEKAAAKAAAAADKPAPKKKDDGPALEEDDDVDPTKYFENRLAWVNEKKAGGNSPYPHKFHVSHTLPEFIGKYESVGGGETLNDTVSVAGRVMSKRAGGKGLVFFDLNGDGAKLQVFSDARKYADLAGLAPEDAIVQYMALMNSLKRGDLVGVEGQPGKIS